MMIATVCAAADKYVVALPVVEGLSVGSMPKLVKDVVNVMNKNTGLNFEVNEIKYKKGELESIFLRSFKEVKDGKADFLYVVSPIQYIKYKAQVDALMTPVFAVQLDGKRSSNVCAYVKKDSPYKSLADLKGKVWGGVHTMEARALMNAQGINTPMAGYFKDLVFVDDAVLTQPFDALRSGKIDVNTTVSYIANMILNANKEYSSSIREIGCTEYEHNWMFLAKKTVPKDVVEKIKKELLSAHKNKDYAQFKVLMMAVKGRFVEFEPSALEHTAQLAALSKKYGWEKEEQDFVKKERPK